MTKQELLKAIDNSSSLSGVIRYLGMNKSSNTYNVIRKKIKEYDITPSFKVKENKKYSDDQIFCENSTYDRKDLRNKIIRENILSYNCCVCGIDEWNGKPLSLQLDHINGIGNDNRKENLRFLCPNCHTQTSTWGNKKS